MNRTITLLDGAMGTMLQRAGLKLGDRPETLSITAPDVVEGIQRQYVQSGTRLLLSNTFCANAHKLEGTGFSVEEVVSASVAVALRACAGTDARVALDIGPIGELLEPLGTLVVVEAEHMCMTARGIKKPGSLTITSAVRGSFKEDEKTRAEALSLFRS